MSRNKCITSGVTNTASRQYLSQDNRIIYYQLPLQSVMVYWKDVDFGNNDNTVIFRQYESSKDMTLAEV